MLELARTLIDGGNERGLLLRAVGGIGVAFVCPSASRAPLVRTWKDIDFVALSSQRRELEAYLDASGLSGDREFNALHGRQRLNYIHPEQGWHVDIFMDRIVMCHKLELADRLASQEHALDPADLLLTKLQVVETNERDYLDILAILSDHEPDHDRIHSLLARDWGWWRTATNVIDRAAGYAANLDTFADRERVLTALTHLREAIEAAPKSRSWRMRARIGERVRWYDLPEEDDGGI
jgi:hypothetical protein